jgi:ABC-type nitrate/sulfonate/bicarbonate transport system substrate-binding protein
MRTTTERPALRHWRNGLTGMAVAILLSTLAACSSSGSSAGSSAGGNSTKSVVVAEIGQVDPTAGLLVHVADKQGFLAREGIKVSQYVQVPATSDAINGLVSGAVNFAFIGGAGVIAKAQGAPVLGLAALFDASAWTLIASKNITSIKELEGKEIALGDQNGITTLVFDTLVQEAGFNPSDFKHVVLGATPARVAAVENGQAAATLATYPTAETALAAGLHNLGLGGTPGQVPALMTSEIVGGSSWAQKNRSEVVSFLRAMLEAAQYIKNPANEAAVTSIMTSEEKVSAAAAKATLNVYFYHPVVQGAYFPSNLEHRPAAYDNTVSGYGKFGLMPKAIPERDWMDYSYLNAAIKDNSQ